MCARLKRTFGGLLHSEFVDRPGGFSTKVHGGPVIVKHCDIPATEAKPSRNLIDFGSDQTFAC